MKTITGVGFIIPSTDKENFFNLTSTDSLSDSDIVVFAPTVESGYYSTYEPNSLSSGRYDGKPLYNKASSALMKKNSNYWKKEIKNYLNSGKTLYVILEPVNDFYIHTGESSTSGTGRNQKVTDIVTEFSFYKFLPFKDVVYHSSKGKTLIPTSPVVKQLYESFKDLMKYEVYIEKNAGPTITPLFSTKSKDKILGGVYEVAGGRVVFLPHINLNIPSLKNKGGKSWSDEGLKKGKHFESLLVGIEKAILSSEEKSVAPEWIKDNTYDLEDSQRTMRVISLKRKELEQLQESISDLEAVLAEQEGLKDLLYETGKPLERAVTRALKILGFNAEGYDNGELELDQVITSPEGYRYIGECEGKDSKDIDVTKFRQLSDSLSEDFQRDDVIDKAFGIIFGNPQRLTEPTNRSLDFTDKCKRGAERERIALVKTVDLFNVCQNILQNKNEAYKKLCRKAIHNQLGKVVQFPA